MEGGYKRLNSDLGVGKFGCIEVGTSLSKPKPMIYSHPF